MSVMTPQRFLETIIVPAAALLPELDSPEARCLLLAIAGQESAWTARLQTEGPARGFWQCEKTGAVLGVLTGPADRVSATLAVCNALQVPLHLDTIYEAIAWNDSLAYCVARITLAADPAPLPAIGERDAAWETYVRNWRPGRPRPESWAERYDAAAVLFSPRPPSPASPAST